MNMQLKGNTQNKLVILVIIVLAAVEPLTHVWIHYFPPEGAVPTGIHTGDSAHHILCLRSFDNGFYSPFVTCKTTNGDHDFTNYAAPLFLLYGVAGEIQRLLHLDEFIFLGLLNGLGGALYLIMAWRLLRLITPKHAHAAFFLFTLGGGLGGVTYMMTGIFGAHTHPAFDTLFYRLAQYELMEGQHLSPLLLMPRFYYTLPMALGLAALQALIETDRNHCLGHLTFSGFLFCLCSAVNLRVGPLFCGIGLLYLSTAGGATPARRIGYGLAASATTGLGAGIFFFILNQHPAYQENITGITRMAMELFPFLSTTLLFWPAALIGLFCVGKSGPRLLLPVVCALVGYLMLYSMVYFTFQVYWSNWAQGGSTSAPIAASDYALYGVVVGFFIGCYLAFRRGPLRRLHEVDQDLSWIALWLLLFTALAVSAFNHPFTGERGWFLRFAPQRCMIFIGLPLAVLTARGLTWLRPTISRSLYGLILCCGIISLIVASFAFQGPFGRSPGTGPFAYLNYAHMTAADAALLEELPQGTIAVPPWSPIAFGEVIALRSAMKVLGGPGAMNLGDRPFGPLQEAVNTFFKPETPDNDRRSFAKEWCVDYVYLPDTCPVPEPLLQAFKKAQWLKEIAHEDQGYIFLVALE
jgi:hypothetical protein